MQIRTRLTLQFILIVASILFFSFFAIYYFSEKHRENEFYSILTNKAITTADLLIKVQEVDSSLLKTIEKSKKDVLFSENISVYNSGDGEIYTNNDTIKFPELLPGLNKHLEEVRILGEKRISIGKMDIIGLSYNDKSGRFVIMAAAIDRLGLEKLVFLGNFLITVFFVVLAVVGLAGWVYAGRALKPISSVMNEVDKISETNLNLRLNEGSRKDEIARLSATFNKMLNRIESAFKIQKAFVANASHELRNPLTKVTSQLEVSLLKERNNEEYKKLISSVLEDIKNLNGISHRLLQLEKISSLENGIKFSNVRIDELLWESKAEFLAQHPGCNVSFFLSELPEDESQLFIPGHGPFLKICFQNLMDNACKFSRDKSVEIKLSSEENEIIVKFTDKGKGIDKEDLPYIFEPFYRSKKTASTLGYGIGLSLVDKITRLHHARVEVNSLINTGTCFTLFFPRH